MNCLIVDDQKIFREVIKRLVEFDPTLVLLASCANAEEAQREILQHKIDLLFLDIRMPGMSGIELAKQLGDKKPLIIFTTSETEFAAEAFDLSVVDFLVKPISHARFIQAIEKAKMIIKKKNISLDSTTDEFVFIRTGNSIKRIRIDEILFLEATRDYVTIVLPHQTYSIHSSLKEVEQKLPKIFIRVHRSFIVNLSKIDTAEGKNLIMDKYFIPVSDAYRASLNEKMSFL